VNGSNFITKVMAHNLDFIAVVSADWRDWLTTAVVSVTAVVLGILAQRLLFSIARRATHGALEICWHRLCTSRTHPPA
jgi:hypothetical protein